MTQFWAPTLESMAPLDFECFVRYNTGWDLPPHQVSLCRVLQSVAESTGKRVIISAPPQHGKSEFISVQWPAWLIGRDPLHRVMLASYNTDHSEGFGMAVQELVKSPKYARIFPKVHLARHSKAMGEWRTVERGGSHHPSFTGKGIGGGITGRGADTLILDDVIENAMKAYSVVERENVWNWWTTTASTRLNVHANVVVMFTRWLDDDLIGRLNRSQPHTWEKYNYPAIALKDDILGRAEGEALWPERFPVEFLERQRAQAPMEFQAMYQGDPVIEGGNIIRADWLIPYKTLPEHPIAVICSYDTAMTEKEQNDPNAGVHLMLGDDGYIYLLYAWSKHIETFRAENIVHLEAQDLSQTYVDAFKGIFIEGKASGHDLASALRRKTMLPVNLINPVGDKMSRLKVHQALFESGRFRVPDMSVFGAARGWLPGFIDELTRFPKGRDDLVDATTQGLKVLAMIRAKGSGVTVGVIGRR
jgi:predicted phage terminase large subunit-like protein